MSGSTKNLVIAPRAIAWKLVVGVLSILPNKLTHALSRLGQLFKSYSLCLVMGPRLGKQLCIFLDAGYSKCQCWGINTLTALYLYAGCGKTGKTANSTALNGIKVRKTISYNYKSLGSHLCGATTASQISIMLSEAT